VDQCWTELQESLDVHNVNNYLRGHLIFNATDFESVNNEQTEERRRMKLLEIVKRKDNGLQTLLDGLSRNGQNFLAKQLQDALKRPKTAQNANGGGGGGKNVVKISGQSAAGATININNY